MPSVISSVERPRPVEGSTMQLECLEFAGCNLDRYISEDNSLPSFLEVFKDGTSRSSYSY